MLAQGYAPTKHTVKFTVETDLPNITAFRLELLNDPNLPLGGPGRSIKGTGALTEFEVEAAPAATPDKITKIKFVRATADINLARNAAGSQVRRQERQAPRHRADRIRDRRQGRDRVGHRCRTRLCATSRAKPSSCLTHPISNPGGAILSYLSAARITAAGIPTTTKTTIWAASASPSPPPRTPTADPLPANRARVSTFRRERQAYSGADAGNLQLLAHHGRASGKRRTSASQALWKQHPEGSSQLVLADPNAITARNPYAEARRLPAAGQAG